MTFTVIACALLNSDETMSARDSSSGSHFGPFRRLVDADDHGKW